MEAGYFRSRPEPAPRGIVPKTGLLVALLSLWLPAAGAARTFGLEERNGVWWLTDPDGRRFLSIGVDMVNHGTAPGRWEESNPSYSALRSYPSAEEWERDTVKRLKAWGFNTIGAWGDRKLCRSARMPYTVCLHLGSSASIPWTDMWDRDLEERVMSWGREWTEGWRADEMLIGYFPDNEMSWWDETVFAFHLAQSWREKIAAEGGEAWKENHAKLRLFRLFEREYASSLDRLKEDWEIPEYSERTEKGEDGKDFTKRVPQRIESFGDLRGPVALKRRLGRCPRVVGLFMAELYDRYGELMHRAIKGADPDHLLLGERYYGYYAADQVREAGKWTDVVSTNRNAWSLDGWISPNHIDALTALSGRPAIVGEYYFCAMENRSGNRNSSANFATVGTQEERERGYAAQARQMAGMAGMVGWHWFQYFDEPTHGRGDGEDYNMGLVDIRNEPYAGMVRTSIEINRAAMDLHARARVLPVRGEGQPPAFAAPGADPPVLDGDLRDWDKPAAWMPGAGGRPHGVPFGDFFASRSPGLLNLAIAYQEPYRDRSTAQEFRPEAAGASAECERLTVAWARADGSNRGTVEWTRCPGSDGWSLKGAPKGVEPRWSRAGHHLEISLPVEAGSEMKLAILLRSWGDSQLIYWSAYPLHENADPATWGILNTAE